MRFNGKELANLAQTNIKFDFESPLYIIEKSDFNPFKKNKEVFVERFFKLKGNLLFYFKTKEKSSEVVGVHVLERFYIQLEEESDSNDLPLHCFSITFLGDDSLSSANTRSIFLATQDEKLRDKWVEHLHIASYECMRIQMDSLIEQIKNKTGTEPNLNNEDALVAKTELSKGVYIDLGISCNNLQQNNLKQQPNTFCCLSINDENNSNRFTWQNLGKTEIVESSCNPRFYKLISLQGRVLNNLSHTLKLSVHVIFEKMTTTSVVLGSVEFNLQDVLLAPNFSLQFSLNSLKDENVGRVTIDAYVPMRQLSFQRNIVRYSFNCRSKPSELDLENLVAKNSLKTSFRLPIKRGRARPNLKWTDSSVDSDGGAKEGSGDEVVVREVMTEFKPSYSVAVQILNMYIEDEKAQIEAYKDLGELETSFDVKRNQIVEYHISTLANYQQQVKYLSNCEDSSFKPSLKKDHKEVEFIPTNLHMQTFSVINLHNNINNKNKNNNNKNNDNINKNNSNMYGKSLLTGSKSNFLKNSNTININNNNNNNNNQNINNNNLKDSINNIYIGSTNSSNNFSGSNSLSNTFSNSVVCTGMVSDAQSPKKMLGICGDPDSRLDVVTVGAFTAYSQKYKSGGLRRMVQQLDEAYKKSNNGENVVRKSSRVSTRLNALLGKILQGCDYFCSLCVTGKTSTILRAFSDLESLVNQLTKEVNSAFLKEVLHRCHQNKVQHFQSDLSLDSSGSDQSSFTDSQQHKRGSNPEFICEEPWAMQLVNIEESLVCLRSQLSGIEENEEKLKTKWLDTLSPLIVKLRALTNDLCDKCVQALIFNNIEPIFENLPLHHTHKYRRDIVFCQGLTSLLSGMLLKLSSILPPESHSPIILTSTPSSRETPPSSNSVNPSLFQAPTPHSDTGSRPVDEDLIFFDDISDEGSGGEKGEKENDDEIADENESKEEIKNDNDINKIETEDEINEGSCANVDTTNPKEIEERFKPAPPQFTKTQTRMARILKNNLLLQFESLLSCSGDEMCMLEDQLVAMEELAKVKIIILPHNYKEFGEAGCNSKMADNLSLRSNNSNNPSITGEPPLTSPKKHNSEKCLDLLNTGSSNRSNANSDTDLCNKPLDLNLPQPPTLYKYGSLAKLKAETKPQVSFEILGDRRNCSVAIYIPKEIYKKLCPATGSDHHRQGMQFGVVPVLFSIGINEQATLAERLFNTELQEMINRENFKKLNDYYHAYTDLDDHLKTANEALMLDLMSQLKSNVFEVKRSKNVKILSLAAKMTHQLDGMRFTSCKSAKDRSSMSITLEEAEFVQESQHSFLHNFSKALDSLRSEGVRRENSLKNSGVRKYAFNSIQLVSIPKLYRPPKGTYGNLET